MLLSFDLKQNLRKNMPERLQRFRCSLSFSSLAESVYPQCSFKSSCRAAALLLWQRSTGMWFLLAS